HSQFNGFRSKPLYDGTKNFRTRLREKLSRNSEFAILTFDLLVSAFPLVGAPTKSPIKKICTWALAIGDCRAASCLRIRDGAFRAAAIPAPRGRRNHQALLEGMETVS